MSNPVVKEPCAQKEPHLPSSPDDREDSRKRRSFSLPNSPAGLSPFKKRRGLYQRVASRVNNLFEFFFAPFKEHAVPGVADNRLPSQSHVTRKLIIDHIHPV